MKSITQSLILLAMVLPALALIPFDPTIHQLSAGKITTSTDHLMFSDRVVNTNTTFSFKLYNGSGEDLHIEHISTANAYFEPVYPWPETVGSSDSAEINIRFSPFTNIEFIDHVFIEIAECNQAVPVRLSGNGWLMPSAYLPTFNLFDEELKDALDAIFSDQLTLGYSNARSLMYGHVDNFNDSLECVYTGFRQYHPEGSSSTFPDPINCEHSWPQSAFNSLDPMMSDMHHLFPTHGSANSARSNYPFGDVVSNTSWESGGSRRGQSAEGSTVFEPRDVHKGDVARVMFYFITRYWNCEGWMNSAQEEDLRAWTYQDPVSQKEIDRNNGIFGYQQNRNPFVDHPYFLERITSMLFAINRPDSSVLKVAPPERIWHYAEGVTMDTLRIILVNSGNISYAVSGIGSDNTDFVVMGSFPLTVEAGERAEVPVAVSYTAHSNNARLEIQSDATVNPTAVIEMTYHSVVSAENQLATSPVLLKAFPNPFNGGTRIRIPTHASDPGELNIYDLSGRQVYSMNVPAGSVAQSFIWDPAELSGGIYLVHLLKGNQQHILKLMYLK